MTTFTNNELLDIFKTTILGKPFNRSIGTYQTYIQYINYMLKFLDNKNILDITKQDIKRYILTISTSDSYYNGNLSAIKTLYKVLAYHPSTEGLVTDITFGLIMIRNPIKKERLPLSRDEEHMILKGSKNERDFAIIITLLKCGLRIHELIGLTLDQYINRNEDNSIQLVVTKGSKKRDIWLSDEVIDAIDKYLPNRKETELNNLFISNGGGVMDRHNLSRTLKVCAVRGGVDSDRAKEICNHVLRHTAFTDMANNGVNIQTIAKVAGHSNINTSAIYIKVNNNDAKMAMMA